MSELQIISLLIMRENVLFSGEIYTTGKIFTLPPAVQWRQWQISPLGKILKIILLDNWILFASQEDAQIVINDQNLINMPKIQSKQVTT